MNAFLSSVNTHTWTNGRHLVRCVKVVQETWDVRTFSFMAEQPVMFFFKPGEFVTLELLIDGQQVMRSYTISSSPSLPYSFSITVKRVPGGQVSNWMHDNLQEGLEVAVHGPVGNFNCIDFPAKKVLLLSGGVGITPVMSMARWWFDTNSEVDMVFVHSARTPKDIIYRRELEHMDSRITNFNLSLICERYEIGETWSGFTGYLGDEMLKLIAPDFMERKVFCCGPTPYMRAIKSMLQRNGFPMTEYHEESFGATPKEVEKDVVELAEQAQVASDNVSRADMLRVEFIQAGKSVQIESGETVHTAAAKLGLYIPKACGMGICGTCKVRKISGAVDMEHNGGISDADVSEGFILSCCSTPLEDIVLDY